YDFDRLRRKLGLLDGAPPAAAAAGGADIGAMGTAELSALAVDSLSEAQLEQARQSAVKLDVQELATKFAQTLIARPRTPGENTLPDRGPTYLYLVQQAVAANDTDTALNLINDGESDDCEHNEGRRQADYELRRAQVLVKRREADAAFEV